MIAFSLGPIHIYRYGIMYLLAFIFGYLGFRYIAKKQFFAKNYPRIQMILDKHLEDFLIVIFLGVLLGGRLGHVIIYNLPYYLAHPGEIIRFRDGGMSFIGGIFGVIIGFLAFRKWKKGVTSDLWVLFDILLVLLPLGIAFGRLGNYLNQELYGIAVSPSFLPGLQTFLSHINILHIYPKVDGLLRINTNWLAIFFEGLVTFVGGLFVFRHQIRKHLWRPGLWSAIFLIRYSFIRFLLEYLRVDSQMEFYGRFTISQWFFVIFFIFGITLLWRVCRKK